MTSARDALVGARVRRIDMPSGQLLALGLGGPTWSGTLLLRAEPRNVAVGAVLDRPPSPTASGFVTFLRKHIEGLAVSDVRAVQGALAIDLRGGPVIATLYLERTPNVVLEKDGRTIGALQVKANEARGEKLGQPWHPPSGEPIGLPETLDALLAVGAAMTGGAGLAGGTGELGETEKRRRLLKRVKSELERLVRRRDAIERDVKEAARSQVLASEAQLLLTHAHEVSGAGPVRLADADGTERTIDLGGLSPFDAAERRFEQARRLRAGESVARERLSETDGRIAELEALMARIEDDDEDVAQLAEDVDAAVRPAQPKPKRGETSARLPYREIKGTGDRLILVGRAAADNDHLTTKVARPHDLWLHARGAAGSHVVVPLEKGESIPSQLLVDAATLAAHFSDARGQDKVEVTYVEKRHVRKKKGQPPGMVSVERDKTMLVRIEPERLGRLLQGKR